MRVGIRRNNLTMMAQISYQAGARSSVALAKAIQNIGSAIRK
jgi:hypothetical protein